MTYFITTSISYANGIPHVGHAYEAVLADALARHHRLSGEVFFQTGTDEHGLKVAQAAAARSLDPLTHATEIAELFRAMCDRLDVSYDRFIRTTELDNLTSAQTLWSKMKDAGDIYKGNYEGWYSVREESYFSESEIVEEGGQKLSPNGTPVEFRSEESYFFMLENYRQRILAHIVQNPDFIVPESARNEMIAMMENPLPDLSISRVGFDWGVPVPGDAAHVMYVWVDALSNYAANPNIWPADVHVIGKDISKFHCIYWPAFLMSATMPLPKQVLVHGFLTHNGIKMSKSIGNVIDPMTEADRVGSDCLRYYLLRQSRLGQDSDYRDTGPDELYNLELANTVGNLVQRICAQIAKNCGGVIPEPLATIAEDCALGDSLLLGQARYNSAMQEGKVFLAIEETIALAIELNGYIHTMQPWTVRRDDPERADTILYHALQGARIVARLLLPIIPKSAQRLLDTLGNDAEFGTKLPYPNPVFPRK